MDATGFAGREWSVGVDPKLVCSVGVYAESVLRRGCCVKSGLIYT